MSTYKQASDGRPDGLMVGQSATGDKVGFFGTTPVVQPSSASQAAVTTSVTTTRTTANLDATCDAIIVLLNQIRSELVTLGLLKGSA